MVWKVLLIKPLIAQRDRNAGAEFVEMFQGVAAARIRSLFYAARKVAPAIIFIGEPTCIPFVPDLLCSYGICNMQHGRDVSQCVCVFLLCIIYACVFNNFVCMQPSSGCYPTTPTCMVESLWCSHGEAG